MDDVFGGLEQPEPGDFGAQDFAAAMPADSYVGGGTDTPTGEVAEYVTIDLDGDAGNGVVISCGGSLSGHVSWSTKQNVRGVSVELGYQTEGRGTTDRGSGRLIELPADQNGSAPFHFEVPISGPMSYFGDMITLRWAITLKLDIPRRRDTTTSVPVTVMPYPG